MIKRLLNTPISTMAWRRIFQVLAFIVTFCWVLTLFHMVQLGYSFGATLLASLPFLLAKFVLLIIVAFSSPSFQDNHR